MFCQRALQAFPLIVGEAASFEVFGFAFAFGMLVVEEVIEHFCFVNQKMPGFREIVRAASHSVNQHPLR